MASMYRDNLVTLKELKDFKVADKDADVRSWRVSTSDGIKIGRVDELVVDREAMKVRYLDIHLNKDIFDRDVDRHVLIPIGLARIHRENERVLLENMTASELLTLPPYAPGPITVDYERSLRQTLNKTQGNGGEVADDFYDHEHFNADQFYGRASTDARHESNTSHIVRP